MKTFVSGPDGSLGTELIGPTLQSALSIELNHDGIDRQDIIESILKEPHQISINLTADGITAVNDADSVTVKYDSTQDDVWLKGSNNEMFNQNQLGYNLKKVQPILESITITPPASLSKSDDRVAIEITPSTDWTWSKDNDIHVSIAPRSGVENNFEGIKIPT